MKPTTYFGLYFVHICSMIQLETYLRSIWPLIRIPWVKGLENKGRGSHGIPTVR